VGDVGPLFGWFKVGDESRDFESNYQLDTRSGAHDISAFFPRTDFTVDLGPEDSLYIGAMIRDRDPGSNPNDTIFSWWENIPPLEIHTGEWRLVDWSGRTLSFMINVTPMPRDASAVTSDRNLKSNVAAVNPREVLARLAQVPVSTWNYTSDGPAIRHIGTMAQDFYAAFGVGETDTRIMQVDADGVAFAAVQGLYQVVQEKDAQIAVLQKQNATLEARVAALEQRLGNQPLAALPLPLDAFLPWLIVGAVIGIGFVRARK
jgi:hypothetical protein